MKKTLLSLSLMASSLLFGAQSSYTQFLDTAVEDVYDIHNYSKANMSQMAEDNKALQSYSEKVDKYEADVSHFLQESTNEGFNSKEDANKALDEVNKLSTENVKLAKTMAYLASHQGDNGSDSYNKTLQATSKTILRLSDDIGTMADRILLMAKEIGVMADRIVKTQEIQSQNMEATQKLTRYAMTLTNQQVQGVREDIHTMNINKTQMQQPQQNMPRHTLPQPITPRY